MNLGGVIHLNKPGICIILLCCSILFIYMLSGKSNNDKTVPSVKVNLKHLLQVSIKAAENGGNEVERSKNNLNIKTKGLTKEGLQDRVTTADYLSHCVMMRTLKNAYPNLEVISEEEKNCDDNFVDYLIGDDKLKFEDEWVDIKDVTVWIDPLDATYEYTKKLYDFVTTMVCVAVNGKPIIGVIHKPFSKDNQRTFWAWVDKAKSKNLIFKNIKRDKSKIVVSMSHSGKIKEILAENANNLDVVTAAGAGYKSLEVAMGNFDAYLHITAIKKWDICAGNAIVNAMGGRMTTKFDKEINYKDKTSINENGIVASIKTHDYFLNLVNKT